MQHAESRALSFPEETSRSINFSMSRNSADLGSVKRSDASFSH